MNSLNALDGDPKTIEQLEQEKKDRLKLVDCYEMIIDRLKFYCDLKEEYYSLIALWIIGTYFHNKFPTYAYLFFNAMKGSGKSRLLKLIAFLSKNGSMLNSPTEAVLFRESGTLCIDEFERISAQGKEGIRELLNSGYKKGTKVKRVKKIKVLGQEQQVIEEFDVYRPIAIANIWGMEDVLGDRCITIILEKSKVQEVINLVEIFEIDDVLVQAKTTLNEIQTKNEADPSVLCRYMYVGNLQNMYMAWNFYVKNNYISTLHTLPTLPTLTYTNERIEQIFKKIKESGIDGRNLELGFPLIILSLEFDSIFEENFVDGKNVFENTLNTIYQLVKTRKEEEFIENKDISIIDFLSQEPDNDYFISMSELVKKYREFIQSNEEWINNVWMGRRLNTLSLVKKHKREAGGVKVIPDYKKAQEKIKIFK